jgi:hypothetical protein
VATRTVRLDDEAEAALLQITEATGLPISQAGSLPIVLINEAVFKVDVPWRGSDRGRRSLPAPWLQE